MASRKAAGPRRPLTVVAGAVVVLALLHDLDHLRQGRELPLALNLIGIFGTLGALGVFFWVLRSRSETAARAAELFGALTVIGLVAVHLLPRWSLISDPYAQANVDWLSWLSLVTFLGAGAALAAIAWARARAG